MEEADLLKERLQAITDKRRIQEDIAKKRRQIEEEKLKLQYIKKKALREQWLMDGLSQQSEEEQEAMRLQVQDEQQQSDQLQSNILRIEKEIKALEQKELSVSFNEEIVLKRLKEVEQTPEDIIKELNKEFQAGVSHSPPKIQDISLFFPQIKAESSQVEEANSAETKQAIFAIQISVEHNTRTGKNLVVSRATISPDSIQERGLKVYDDGRKSVYALPSKEDPNGVVGEMSSTEVEELLHQATDETVPAEVQYHHPVYSVPYTGNSRPSASRAPSQIHLKEKTHLIQDLQEPKSPSKLHQQFTSGAFEPDEEAKLCCFHTAEQFKNNMNLTRRSNFGANTSLGFTNSKADTISAEPDGPVPVTVRSEVMPASNPSIPWGLHLLLPSMIRDTAKADETLSDFHVHPATENIASVKLINTLPEGQEEKHVTMIFNGYENALDEEEEDIQAELVIIGDSDGEENHDDHNKCLNNLNYREECLSYHPEGCKSQIFQPKVGIAKVAGRGGVADNTYTHWRDLELHKPTFIHRPGKHSCSTLEQSVNAPADTGCIRQEKLCSTRR
ncbi:palmdelphin-like isoform 1-T4 [Anableps anableps]